MNRLIPATIASIPEHFSSELKPEIQEFVSRELARIAATPSPPPDLLRRWNELCKQAEAGDFKSSQYPHFPLSSTYSHTQISNLSLADLVSFICVNNNQPVLCNLLITQCYYEISAELVKLLGGRNAHWCTFATWASKTAGRFIRNEDVPAVLRQLILSDEDEREVISQRAGIAMGRGKGGPHVGGVNLLTPWWGHGLDLMEIPERILRELSSDIALGNLKVFEELGPLFVRMIQVYRECPRPGDAQLAALLDGLKPGQSREGGQGPLRGAVVRYHEAMLTEDQDRKAELILLANALVGLHEQVRLQPYIARALNAPVRCLRDALGVPGRHLPEALRSVIREQAEKVQAVWRLLATKEMMTMRLPDELLDLGHDLRAPPDLTLHFAELATIDDRELFDLLSEYDAHDQMTSGYGAEDWASLPERMSYILELFRNRQQCNRLFQPPFSPDQRANIVAGRVPLPILGDL
ncbi:hypothetical protein WME97_45370 [Sorangium sp. So ce367]|uniref:hypothetical protein n=1 Tax=Sorangium sp. So ce367 TaxID=3133305 RepID=UPI003F62DB19